MAVDLRFRRIPGIRPLRPIVPVIEPTDRGLETTMNDTATDGHSTCANERRRERLASEPDEWRRAAQPGRVSRRCRRSRPRPRSRVSAILRLHPAPRVIAGSGRHARRDRRPHDRRRDPPRQQPGLRRTPSRTRSTRRRLRASRRRSSRRWCSSPARPASARAASSPNSRAAPSSGRAPGSPSAAASTSAKAACRTPRSSRPSETLARQLDPSRRRRGLRRRRRRRPRAAPASTSGTTGRCGRRSWTDGPGRPTGPPVRAVIARPRPGAPPIGRSCSSSRTCIGPMARPAT